MRRFVAFAAVSGTGLLLDVALYALLCETGVRPGLANLMSAATGVSFVWFVATKRVFGTGGGLPRSRFAAYVAYQVVAVALASVAVDAATVALDDRYLLGKAVVVPVTLVVNFLVVRRLARVPLVPAG